PAQVVPPRSRLPTLCLAAVPPGRALLYADVRAVVRAVGAARPGRPGGGDRALRRHPEPVDQATARGVGRPGGAAVARARPAGFGPRPGAARRRRLRRAAGPTHPDRAAPPGPAHR